MKRISTGIKNLDEMMRGGLPEKTVVLLSGNPGSGKTLLSLTYLIEGITKNERCVYVSLNEGKEELLKACDGIATLKDARKAIGKSFIIEELQISEIGSLESFTKLFKQYPRVDRLVIDSVNKLLAFSENKSSYRRNMDALIRTIKEKSTTSLLVCETEGGQLDSGNGEAYDTDGVVNIEFIDVEEKPMRAISIFKMRYTAIDSRVRNKLDVSSKGLTVHNTTVI